jgi:rod shape determining protein RodA
MASNNEVFTLSKPAGAFFDVVTFMIAGLLIAIGLISIYSATFESGMSAYFDKQLVFAGVSLVVMFVFMLIPKRWLKNFAIIIYGISIASLVGVLFFGVEVYGTRGWFNFGFVSFQPAEFAKIATIIMIARHLSTKGTNIKNLRDLVMVIVYAVIPVILIARQPDIGSASVLVVMLVGILLWVGFDLFIIFFLLAIPLAFIFSLVDMAYLFVFSGIFAIIALLFRRNIIITILAIGIVFISGYTSSYMMNKVLPANSKNRIETFLNPDKDPLGKGYNVKQSKLAVGSGGLTGKGFLQGTQTQLRYIPKQWTDFIYCVPTEEFGFVGGTLVIFLLAALILKAVRTASISDSKFFSIVCIGIASVYFYHTLINIGMVLGLMPVMGIPLPFMSYGGTSLVINSAMIGLLLNAYRDYKSKRRR